MARRVTTTRPPAEAEAAATISAFVGNRANGHARPTKGKNGRKLATVERLAREVYERVSADGAVTNAPELVALYAALHHAVYGVFPGELQGKTWVYACAAAKRLVTEQFAGDYDAAREFLRWVWQREQGREKWRRENLGKKGGSANASGRIGWALQFARQALVTDYRTAQNRELG